MRFIAPAILSLAAMALAEEPSYKCGGQPQCKDSTMKLKFCDDVINNDIIRNDEVNYGTPESKYPKGGGCRANLAGIGCGIFSRGGPECVWTGNELWHDYQDIRSSGCPKCGTKTYDSGCEMVIDYVTGCDS